MADRNLRMAARIAEAVNAAGGRTFLVGGYVRDLLLGKENKDIDIEIHGILPEQLESILDRIGTRTQMGASFGVFGLKGYDIDIAMPRREEATGRGHRDFRIYVDPFLGTYKAAKRRDFTMNAMMQDVLTGEIVDHFNGREDIKAGVLRHVNSETFVEDPLRVLRAAQFAARFGFSVADETVELAKTMDLTALAKERILGELEKAMLKAPEPSIFFEEMDKMQQLQDWFGQVQQLKYTSDRGLWSHTMRVLDSAALVRNQTSNPMGFMLSALVQDFDILDEERQLENTRAFINQITNETRLVRYVLNMLELHEKPGVMAQEKAPEGVTSRLFDRSTAPEDLILLADAITRAENGSGLSDEERAFLKDRLEYFYRIMAKPCVMGADLMEAGLKPCKAFSDYLAFAHELRLDAVDKEQALKETLSYAKRVEAEMDGRN